jgi:adenylate cyclase
MGIIAELKRRRVIRVAIGYAALAWLFVEISATTFPMLRLPDWAPTLVLVLLLIGFPFAIMFAWAYQVTPEGLTRDSGPGQPASDSDNQAAKPDSPLATPVSDQSIAVLPFVNMSDDASNEYFSDGLSEELLNLLARIPGLHVAARTSSFSFKGEKFDIPAVAEKLRVANVLEGSVRKVGNRVRITTQLIKATDGYHLWSETFDRTLEDIFAVQDEIARSVVNALKIRLLAEVPRARETDPEAYSLYLQGMYFVTAGERERFEHALAAFRQALEIDPYYAPAWSGLAHTYWYQVSYGVLAIEPGMKLSMEAVERALELDDTLVEALAVRALLSLSFGLDWRKAEDAVARGLELEPGNARVVLQAGGLAKVQGRFEDAERLLRQAISLDPLNTTAHIWISLVFIAQNRLDEAREILEKVLAMNPQRAVAHQILGRILLLEGRHEEAMKEFEREPVEFWRKVGIDWALFSLGRGEKADKHLESLVSSYGKGAPFQIAESYGWRGEVDKAFEWLERAYTQRDDGLTELLTSSSLDLLKNDPRWTAFLERLGLSTSMASDKSG